MGECGVCGEIVTDKHKALVCGGCTKSYHCICVGMKLEQYQLYCEDYGRDNTLKWLCNSFQDQDKGIIQKETPIAWGKMKDTVYQKICPFGI